ncbi:MAG: LamG domain-containing protein [Thermoplasmatales archaeon]|nr:MAG: LamG domain-containing protein [Thermoplasmatales archaeon]
MKKKAIGICVCMLLIAATIFPVAGTLNASKNKSLKPDQGINFGCYSNNGCPNGTVSYWKLDGTSGHVIDYFNGNDGTNYGATRGVTGQVGNAFSFGGTAENDYVEILHDSSLNFGTGNFTLEAWIKYEGPTNGSVQFPAIMSKRPGPPGSDPNKGFAFSISYWSGANLGTLLLRIEDMNYAPCSIPVDDGEWHHVVAQRCGQNLFFYVDGQLDASVNSSKNASSTGILSLGWDSTSSIDTAWEGELDEVAVYDECIPASTITSHYENGLKGRGYCVINIFGFDHEPLYGAFLEIVNGKLVVKNMVNNKNGVRVYLPPNDDYEWKVEFDEGLDADIPCWKIKSRGIINEKTENISKATMQLIGHMPTMDVEIGKELQPEKILVNYYDGDNPLPKLSEWYEGDMISSPWEWYKDEWNDFTNWIKDIHVDFWDEISDVTYNIDTGNWEYHYHSKLVSLDVSGRESTRIKTPNANAVDTDRISIHAVDCTADFEGYSDFSIVTGANSTTDSGMFSIIDEVMITPNDRPSEPDINGPPEGEIGTEYDYTVMTTDPQDKDLYYFIYWGDGTDTGWLGPYTSGEEVTEGHTWSEQGTFNIFVNAKNTDDIESDWGTLEVTMPKNKPFNFNFDLLSWLFEQFPNAFPILRYILGL